MISVKQLRKKTFSSDLLISCLHTCQKYGEWGFCSSLTICLNQYVTFSLFPFLYFFPHSSMHGIPLLQAAQEKKKCIKQVSSFGLLKVSHFDCVCILVSLQEWKINLYLKCCPRQVFRVTQKWCY